MRRAWLCAVVLLALLAGCGNSPMQEAQEPTPAAFGVAEPAVETGTSDPVTSPALESPQAMMLPEESGTGSSDETIEQASAEEFEQTENTEIVEDTSMADAIFIEINGQQFSVTLDDSPTAEAFRELVPATWEMEELHGNEKFIYLDGSLPSDSQPVGYIETGDLMLYGDNCVVLFYDSFSTSYGYTRIGWVDDPDELPEIVGSGDITASFGLK